MAQLPIAGLQLNILWERAEENCANAEPMIAAAAGAGARLIALPEMFATGFSMDTDAVVPKAGLVRDFLADTARRHRVWLLGGTTTPGRADGDLPYNSSLLISPDGDEVLRYDKLHPFSLADEHRSFAGGTSLTTFEVEGVRVTPLICYDLRFPEPFRVAAERTELFVVIANWPDPRIDAWSTLLRARAIENQAFVLGVNRVGEAQGHTHCGRSALIDPLGETLSSRAGQPGALHGTVDTAEVARIRKRFGFLDDRRPAVYAQLS